MHCTKSPPHFCRIQEGTGTLVEAQLLQWRKEELNPSWSEVSLTVNVVWQGGGQQIETIVGGNTLILSLVQAYIQCT